MVIRRISGEMMEENSPSVDCVLGIIPIFHSAKFRQASQTVSVGAYLLMLTHTV
jgi:hypothetical protein